MASRGQGESEPQSQYDPDTDLSKMEKGFVDLVELVSNNNELEQPDEIRRELKSRYEEVIDQSPRLVADVIRKLDSSFRGNERFKETVEMIIFRDLTVPVANIAEVYKKANLIGKIMQDFGKYERAGNYFFVALNIEYLMRHEFDPETSLDYAEAIFCGVNPELDYSTVPRKNTVGDVITLFEDKDRMRRFIDSFMGEDEEVEEIMTQEEKLFVAKQLLLIIQQEDRFNEDRFNVDVSQLLSEIHLKSAELFIKWVISKNKSEFASFSKNEILYVEYNYAEARRYALEAVASEDEEDLDQESYEPYIEASVKLAKFLNKVGKGREGMSVLQELLDRELDPIGVRSVIIDEIMPYFHSILDLDFEERRGKVHIGMSKMVIKLAEEAIKMIYFETEGSLNHVMAYFVYNIGVVALTIGLFDDVQNKVDFLREIDHPDGDELANKLQEYLDAEILAEKKREDENPNKS